MRPGFATRWQAAICALAFACGPVMALAQTPTPKHGGVLTVEHIDSPPSPSIQEEAPPPS